MKTAKAKVQSSAPRINRFAKHFRSDNGTGRGHKIMSTTNHGTTPDAIAALPEALRKKIAMIQPAVAELSDSNIRKRWEIGRTLREIEEDTSGQYGANPIKAMQRVMPLSKDGLRPMLELARHYDESDVDRLTKFKHPTTGEHLNYSHVMALTRLKDKVAVFKLAEQAVTNGWTSKELNREIIQSKGGPQSKGGRKQKQPVQTTFPAAVFDMRSRLQNVANSIDQIWLAPGGLPDLYVTMASAPGWKPTREILDSISAAVDLLAVTNHKMSGLFQVMNNLKHQAEAADKVSVGAA